jgi:hypothetical protein
VVYVAMGTLWVAEEWQVKAFIGGFIQGKKRENRARRENKELNINAALNLFRYSKFPSVLENRQKNTIYYR